MLELDNVELEFDDDALGEIAQKALDLKTGARGLRSIVEDTMLDVMYEVPSDPSIKKMQNNQKNCVDKLEGAKITRKAKKTAKK
ncbi:MAG: hypothetical protein L6V93_06475 [Clostridiales bacterium]|nr:MAG: hypothetical protein L6V93_06475 [Clostridiales bacterium]